MQSNYRVIFFGTDELSAAVLQTLIDLKVNVVGVITRADKVQGRKQEVIYSEVKKLALANNLNLLQPIKLKENINQILDLKPDLILTCSYGRIIPEEIINTPQFKSVNIHPSLLPKYRGASPIQSAVLNNDNETGVTFLYMTKDLDNGNILFQESFKIDDKITSKDLRLKVKDVIAQMLKKHFFELFNKDIKSIPQDESKVVVCSMINREDEKINWNKTAKEVDAHIRGLYDKPIAYTIFNNNFIKVHQAHIVNIDCSNKQPGTILEINKDGIITM
ncbi:MAG: methionyl-tRNA formyltransferase, partial [Malacoplasma sp.]|nr:methionyl-tRNA formyltransferase [Malacoplasma sp.]